jgi:putative oxidoreductase
MKKLIDLAARGVQGLDFAAPLADLAVRLYVASVFWESGLVKIASWQSTLALFEDEYHVPLLPPEMAAYLATGVELGGAALLAIGLGGRAAAVALSVLNVVAVISYPELSDTGVRNHLYWGLFLLLFAVHGPGMLSTDYLVRKNLMARI